MKKWKDLSNRGKIGRLAIVTAVIAFLFWNPFTRNVILFILPLGSGVDDLVFIAALVLAAVFGSMYLIQKGKG